MAIECRENIAAQATLNGLAIVVFGSAGEDGGPLNLKRVSATRWKYDGRVEIGTNIQGLILVAQSEEIGDIGYIHLTEAELVEFRTRAVPDDQFVNTPEFRRQLLIEGNRPSLTLSFLMCVTPPDENIASRNDQDRVFRDTNSELAVAAVSALPNSDPKKPRMLRSYGNLFLQRFHTTRRESDINNSIYFFERAVQLVRMQGDSPEDGQLPEFLEDAGNAFFERYEQTRNLPDLDQAISRLERAVSGRSAVHADLPQWLNALGTYFGLRSKHTGDVTDISKAISAVQKAIHLTADSHTDMPILLYNLGISFISRFKRAGDVNDISEAISAHEKAIHLISDSDAKRPILLKDLALSFAHRFEYTRDLTDISESISTFQKAIHLIPDRHARMREWLNDLGTAFQFRFEHSGDLADISESISVHQKAIRLAADGDPNMHRWQNNLGNAFMCRFQKTRDLTDISEAISALQQALHHTPNSHPDMPQRLNNLGTAFANRFRLKGNVADISEAISSLQKAVRLTPDDHVDKPSWLNNLGTVLTHRFEQTRSPADISEAISALQKAIHLPPNDLGSMPGVMNNLGNSYMARFKHIGNPYRQAAISSTGSPSIRLRAARNWAQFSQNLDPSLSLDAFDTVIELLSQVAGLEQTMQRRHANLVDISDLSMAAAAAAFSAGRPDKALEWLEQGRCLVWSQLNNLRTPLDGLQSAGSRLELESIESEASMSQKISLQDQATAHVKLAKDWDRLLLKARTIPGYEDFLRPAQCSTILEHLPKSGPVVIVNVHKNRCDALALISGVDDPLHIPLDEFSNEKAVKLRVRLQTHLHSSGVRMRGAEADGDDERATKRYVKTKSGSVMKDILHELWTSVVKPILDGLRFSVSSPSHPSRIWWCVTGPLAFLPIHAAGIYAGPSAELGSAISDFAISSYTPTVSALVERVKKPRKIDEENMGLFMISQPATPNLPPIPATTKEIRAIERILKDRDFRVLCLERDAATVDQGMKNMENHSCVHFACHASQDVREPLRSGFFLHDGPLELSRIIEKQLKAADLAFLSACQTSAGDEKLSEEAVHLAAGMLAAGYRGVVATMWSIKDRYGPVIAEDFYKDLLRRGAQDRKTGFDSSEAAYALHYATQQIRKILDDSESSLLVWVPYVHFGL
ncbi:CHAT domain-containing protein [Flammula alnicola]|nr:CHAT domain-containing protein [Flammula alnicola]